MRVAVIGAGAVGGCLAALLAADGHEITVVARSSAEVLGERGLRLTGAFSEVHVWPRVVSVLTEVPDSAVLATKTIDTETALLPSRAALAEVPLLVMQNGIGGHRLAATVLGHDRIAVGLGTWAVNALEPGVVHVTAGGETVVGGVEGERFETLLGGVLPGVRRAANIEGAQWVKLCINTMNAVPAATGLSMQACAADPGLLRAMAAAMHEAARVALATGLALERVGAIGPETVLTLAGSLDDAVEVPRAIAASFGEVPNLGSTLQSLRKGQRTEVDDLGGAVAAEAARHGTAAPVNAGLVALVHEVERTGVFATRDRVTGLVRG